VLVAIHFKLLTQDALDFIWSFRLVYGISGVDTFRSVCQVQLTNEKVWMQGSLVNNSQVVLSLVFSTNQARFLCFFRIPVQCTNQVRMTVFSSNLC